MTELTVRHEPATGAAVIEIRGAVTDEARFRLRDPYTEKYLTRRGWSKTASLLPGEATTEDGVIRIAIGADLARKIVPGTNLVLDQPTGDFQELLTWPLPVAGDVLVDPPPGNAVIAAPGAAEDAAAKPVSEDAAPAAALDNDKTTDTIDDKPAAKDAAVPSPAPEPLLLDSFEPTIMHDLLHEDEKPAEEATAKAAAIADRNEAPSRWKPAAIAAGLFFVLGAGLGYFWLGSDGGAVRQVRQAAAMQLEKQKWEFERQLKQAREQAANASLGKDKAADAQAASLTGKSDQLARDRDEALKTIADKEKSIAALQQQLADAEAQIEAVKNSAGDTAKAQIEALDKKITSLTATLDKANGDLGHRDQALREAQAKLGETTDQLAASQEAAKKQAEVASDDLNKQTTALTTQLQEARDQLAARDRDLKQAQAKLEDANTEIAATRDAAKSQSDSQSAALSGKIETLTTEVKQSQQQLAERDATLRDVQSKLSVANIQIDALKVFAGKTTEAGLEKTAMAEKLSRLTADLDKTSQALSDREQALADAKARLTDAETRLAAAGKRNDQLVADAGQDRNGAQTAPDSEATNQIQQERDLYASELKTMTGNFSALQAEKTALEKTVASLQSQIKDAAPAASLTSNKAIWGATAIDQKGAIYSLQNQISEKVAQENVTAMCRGKSGARCETLTVYNNACFSVARFEGENPAADNFAYFVHKDWKTASRTAQERCESMGTSCTVRFTACSPDGLSKPAAN